MTNDSIVDAISLSLPLDQLMGYRQICTTVTIPHFIRNVFFKGSRVSFCVHVATHKDLPWSIPDWEEPKVASYLASLRLEKNIPESETDIEKWLDQVLAPTVVPCVILDITFLSEAIEPFLEKNVVWKTHSDHLRWNLKAKEFMELYESLHVTVKLLHEMLDGYDVARKLVVFHAGWLEKYYRKRQDYSDPLNECFRAYLCHPYLMQEEALWLLDRNALGIAIDFPSPDEPFYYVNNQVKQPYIEEATAEFPHRLSDVRPVHVCLLSQGKLLIENLANLEMVQTGQKRVMETRFCILPLQLRIRDSAALQIYALQRSAS